MKKKYDLVPTELQDSFLRVYPRVLSSEQLTLLEKLIISDIISYQLRGQSYFKTSSEVAKSFGDYSTKSIQTAFQKLSKMGVVINEIKNGTGIHQTLRYSRVIDLEYWVLNHKYYKGKE